MRGCASGLAVVVTFALLGCVPGGPGGSRPTEFSGATTSGPPTTITVAAVNGPKSYAPWDLGNPSGGGESLWTIHTSELVTNDLRGGLEARIATRLPALDDGSIVVVPEGRMQTRWQLRPNVKWHDGSPFTADDVVFSWQLFTHPELPSRGSAQTSYFERIDVPDPLTFVVTWKATFYDATRLSNRELPLFPKHLLSDAMEGDKEAFMKLPYWTTDYVHLGPFRLVDYGFGETQIYQRFEEYFLGRPKVDRVIIRMIPNDDTVLANLLAGAVDIAAERALATALFKQLADDWRRSGDGVVVVRQENWWHLIFQFNPEWGSPPELSRDARLRRGLYYALDRDALREFILPGFANTEADSFVRKDDPRGEAVGQPFARYLYDPARAAQELADGGWRRAADGRLRGQQGQPVQVEVRGSAAEGSELVPIVARYWRDVGLDVQEEIVTPARTNDREYRAKFPGAQFRASNNGSEVFPVFDSRLRPTPQNRYLGLGAGSYSNPEMDRMIDRLYSTLDRREQGLVMKDLGDLIATDLPSLSLYFNVRQAAVRKGVRALVDDYPGADMSRGALARNAHLWERE